MCLWGVGNWVYGERGGGIRCVGRGVVGFCVWGNSFQGLYSFHF